MASEGVVQVAPDSTGKKIRNLQMQVPQSDGSIATTFVQAVAVLDEEGNLARFSDDHDAQQQMLDELRAIRIGIQLLVDWLNPAGGAVTAAPGPSTVRVGLPIPSIDDNELIDIARDLRQDEDL